MIVRALSGAFAAIAFLGCACTARAADAACWALLYRTIEHSAGSAHAPFITYDERLHVSIDGRGYERAAATITYRDDGIAWVDDNRYGHPFLSRILDPGPPVLGPYGHRRSSWLSFDTNPTILPTIANAWSSQRRRCERDSDDVIDGVTYAHLVFPDAPTTTSAVREMWIDPQTLRVGRLVVSAPLHFDSVDGSIKDLVKYTIAMQNLGGIDVVQHVWWTYKHHVYSQYSVLRGEYTFSDYRFADKAPAGALFASVRTRR